MKPTINHDEPRMQRVLKAAPRRASHEFPDQETVDQLGVDLDVDSARLVLRAVSAVVCHGRSRSRMTVYHMLVCLAYLGRQPIERNGVAEPAPYPALPSGGWPQGLDVFRRGAFSSRDLETNWVRARRSSSDPCLPAECALAFVPAVIWPMLATFMAWGPHGVHLRMEWALEAMVHTPTQRQRRRRDQGSPLALQTIKNYQDGAWRLMKVLVEMRSATAAESADELGLLDPWTYVPERLDPRQYGAKDASQDNTGPTVVAAGARLRHLASEARAAQPDRAYIKRRRSLLLALLCFLGGRANELRVVRVEDYLPAHRFRDGREGPALRTYPNKNWSADEAHHNPLPAELARRAALPGTQAQTRPRQRAHERGRLVSGDRRRTRVTRTPATRP